MKKSVVSILSVLVFSMGSLMAKAECTNPEVLKIKFVKGGEDVTAESDMVGVEDPCDDFGGARGYSSKYAISVYVNFNIEGTIDLDVLDQAYETYAQQSNPNLLGIGLAVVQKSWIERVYGEEIGKELAFVNMAGTTLFVNETALEPKTFKTVIEKFYQIPAR